MNNKKEKRQLIRGETMLNIEKGLSGIPEVEYVFERWGVQSTSLMLFVGTGCSGKTMMMQYLAVCASTGTPMFGQFPIRKGKVIHLDQEQSENQTLRRYARIAAGMGIKEVEIERMVLDRRLDAEGYDLTETEQVLTNRFTGATLVIIDSLKAVSSADENSADIEVVLKMLKRVGEACKCAIIIVHHKGKTTSSAKQSGRGHSSIYDSVDVQIDLDGDAGIYELDCRKNRDGKFFAGMMYQLLDQGGFNEAQNCSEKLVFDLLQADVKPKTVDIRANLLQLLHANGVMNKGELYTLAKGDRVAHDATVKSLIDEGTIAEEKKGRACMLSITGKGMEHLTKIAA